MIAARQLRMKDGEGTAGLQGKSGHCRPDERPQRMMVRGWGGRGTGDDGVYVRANQPSSSSRLVRAGNGAPGASFSYSGSLT